MKRRYFIIAAVLSVYVISSYFIYNNQIPNSDNHPPLKTPRKEHPGVVLYEDRDYQILAQEESLVIRGLMGENKLSLPESDITHISRLDSIIAASGIFGEAVIDDGFVMAGQENIYVVSINPQAELITSYPNPRTHRDKIIVVKETNKLYYYQQGQLVRKYEVATGIEPEYTPEGNFTIVSKIPYPNGDEPDPLLGVRWMGLAVPCEKDNRAENDQRAPCGEKYGIHGTNEPESIGAYASGGCVRMNNEDVMELYEKVAIGTEVEIR